MYQLPIINPMSSMSTKPPTITRLHLGCGNITPRDWINLDGSWNAYLAKYPLIKKLFVALKLLPKEILDIKFDPNIVIHDLTKTLPFPDNSMTSVYSSHVLEHLYLEDAQILLREIFRVLKPEGYVRTIVPSLENFIKEYRGELKFSSQPKATSKADRLLKRLDMRSESAASSNLLVRIYTTLKDFHSHKWLYDQESLTKYLKDAGFVHIKKKKFRQSSIPNISSVEVKERDLNIVGLCLEAQKPDQRTS